MPAFVRTAADEAKWKRAKAAVRKSQGKREAEFTSRDWGLVTHIFNSIDATYSADTMPTFGVNVGSGSRKLGELTSDDVRLNSISEWAALSPIVSRIKRRLAALTPST